MNVEGVIIGALLFLGGIYFLLSKERLAYELYQFYNRPRREGTFAWVDKRIAEPGETACLVIATVFGFAAGAIGLTVIVLNWS